VDGDRVKDPLHGLAAFPAHGYRVVRDRLEDLELVTVAAAVLVDRHRGAIIAARPGLSWHSATKSAGDRDPTAIGDDI
jgi:hypothetical protein